MTPKPTIFRALLIVASLLVLLVVSAWLTSRSEGAENELEKVWQAAQESGAYHYDTTIVQTTRPLPRLENVGLSSKEQRFFLEGDNNLIDRSMYLKLWSQGGSLVNGQNSIELSVQDGKTEGRVAGEAWHAVDNITQLMAPNQDSLSYLVAARNVLLDGQETRSGVSFTRYTFDIDGPAFAEYMRQRMQDEMLRTGKLPPGLSLDLSRQYVEMEASGEIWVGADGLPLRQIIHLVMPPGNLEQVDADITTDFSNWAAPTTLVLGMVRLPSAWFHSGLISQTTQTMAMYGFVFIFLAWLIFQRGSRLAQTIVAVLVIAAMLFGPLLESQQVAAYFKENASQGSDSERAEQSSQADLTQSKYGETELADSPDEDTLQSVPVRPTISKSQSSTSDNLNPLASSGIMASTLDTDQDGLTDVQEQAILTDPNDSDSDDDTLTDGVEVNSLGTDPLSADSDADGLDDPEELREGVDPLSSDTNRDGQPDGLECYAVISDPLATCEDTDNDGEQDVFDFDNDGDGVPDAVDTAPTRSMSGWTKEEGMAFSISGFSEPGLPLLVDFQLRPENAGHLWYTLNVLDWPSNDREGQQRRVTDSTFGASGKDANGDLRLIPMLEITITPESGWGGLPSKVPGIPSFPPEGQRDYAGITAWLNSWLDVDALNNYGISVRPKDQIGTLVLNVPLNLVVQETGDSPVAFAGRMFYRPLTDSLGGQQQVRLAWLLYGLQDACREIPYNFQPEKSPGERYDNWCAEASNWDTTSGVIHTYYDDWSLTGLQVQQYDGIDVGVIFESPAYSGNPNYEAELWHVADWLGQTFLAGRPITPTLPGPSIMMTVDEIYRRWNSASGASDDERWNIPTDALEVLTDTFSEPGELATIPMTMTKNILADYFTLNGQPLVDAPTLMFAREERSRSVTLDMTSASIPSAEGSMQGGTYLASSLSINFSGIPLQTMAGMNWAPYRYVGAGAWEAYPINEYLQSITPAMTSEFTENSQEDGEAYDELRIAGRVFTAKNQYLSLYLGGTSTVQFEGQIELPQPVAETEINNDPYAYARSANTVVAGVLGWILEKLDEKRAAKAAAAAAGKNAAALADSVDLETEFGKVELGDAGSAKPATAAAALESLKDGKPTVKNSKITPQSMITIGVIVANVIYYGLYGAQKLFGLEGKAMDIALEAMDYTRKTAQLAKAIADLSEAIDKMKQGVSAMKSAAKNALVVGLVIEVVASLGLFLFQVFSAGITFLSLAFDLLLAGLIATIIVAIIMFAIACIPVIGPLIVAIFGLIDAVIALICKLTGADESKNQWVQLACGGISAALAKLVQFLIYSQNPIVDIQNGNRFKLSDFSPMLSQPDLGFQVGNTLGVSLHITNTLFLNSPNSWMAWFHSGHYSEGNARRSAFDYAFQTTKINIHDPLSTSGQKDYWQSPAPYGGKVYMTKDMDSIAAGKGITFAQAGINKSSGLYLAEGYKILAQECITIWVFVPIPICWLRDDGKTLHTDLGEDLVFDIFPASLDEFYSLASRGGGYALSWDANFPTLADADGDGLRSSAWGGNDPNDSNPDIDSDGLSDFFEIKNGLSPQTADADADGLSDYWEVFYGTDPYLMDTDSDGLTDQEELLGWDFVYDFNASAQPLKTIVNSDPLAADTDGDGISDKQEKIYGFNPRVWSELNVIRLASGILEDEGEGNLVPSDGYAIPGETLYYTATVENALNQRYVDGLLEVEVPSSLQPLGLEPQTFSLAPYLPGGAYHQANMSGDLTINPSIVNTEEITLTNRASAIISTTLPAAAHSLWLDLDQAAYTPGAQIPDEANKGNSVTCQNCPTSQDGAAYFDGTNDFVTASGPALAISNAVGASGFTMALWVNPGPIPYNSANHGIIGFSPDGSSCPYPSLRLGSAISGGLDICFNDQWHHHNGTPDVARWSHMILTYDKTYLRLYINGLQVDETTQFVGAPLPSGAELTIGKLAEEYFAGSIKGVEIYPFALSATDIEAYYGKYQLLHLSFEPPQELFDSSYYQQDVWPESPESYVYDLQRGYSLDLVDGDYLDLFGSNLDLFDKPGLSLSAWVQPAAATVDYLFGDGESAVSVRLDNNTYTWATYIYADVQTSVGDCSAQAASRGGLMTFKWSHVLVTFDESYRLNIYINGELRGAHHCSGPLTGSLYGLNLSSPSLGVVDEMRIDGRALSDAEARMLAGRIPHRIYSSPYASDGQTLWLDFEEGPGSRQYSNSTSSSVVVEPCSNVSRDCPVGGLPGRNGQAAYFNGTTDYLVATGLELRPHDPFYGFTEAAWIYPTHTDSAPHGILGSLDEANPYPSLMVVETDRLKAIFSGSAGSCEILSPPGALTLNSWNHVAVTRDNMDSWGLWVNGQLVISSTCLSQPTVDISNVAIGKVGNWYFQGLIDDVVLYANTELLEVSIADLWSEPPEVYLGLDEPRLDPTTGTPTTLFTNANPDPAYGPGMCSLNPAPGDCACPQAGADGWVRRATVFSTAGVQEGVQQCIQVNTGTGQPLNNFTIGGWFKPTAQMEGSEQILADSNSFKLSITDGMTVTMSVTEGYNTLEIHANLVEDQWNHIIAMQGSKYPMSLYVNGILVDTASEVARGPNNTPIRFGEGFNGMVDELILYDRELSDSEVQALYDYQVRWFDTTNDHKLTIDAEPPSAVLDYSLPTIGAVEGQVMAIHASDDASGVAQVEYQVFGAGAPIGWQPAVQDQNAWLFTINTQAGAQYDIQVRATDVAGNISAPAQTTFFVDGNPPSTTLDSALISTPLKPAEDKLTLYGTVNDALSGVSGMSVALVDRHGAILDAPQTPQLAGSNWTTDYPMPPEPNGIYQAQLTAWDSLGNTGVITPGEVLVDGVAPIGDINYTGVSTITIHGNSTNVPPIEGIADETPYPTNPILRLHMEESPGTDEFFDSSLYHWVGSCDGACPTMHATGITGYAAHFSGNQDIHMPITHTLDVENALSVWIRPDWNADAGILPAVVGIREGGAQAFSLHIQGNYQGVSLWNGTQLVTYPATLVQGQWQHLAVTLAQGYATVYLDGEPLGSQPFVPGDSSDLPLHIGSADGTQQFFAGEIDELALYDRSLSAAQIEFIVHPVSSGVAQVELGFLHEKDLDHPETLTWYPAELANPYQPYSTWQIKPPMGLEGPYHVYLRLTDALGNQRIQANVWQGEIETMPPRLEYTKKVTTMITAQGEQTYYEVKCRAEDYNLIESAFYCPNMAQATLTYYQEPWLTEIYSGTKLYAMETPIVIMDYDPGEMMACDMFENCRESTVTVYNYLPLLVLSSRPASSAAPDYDVQP